MTNIYVNAGTKGIKKRLNRRTPKKIALKRRDRGYTVRLYKPPIFTII
ncbi:MAG: hypothetical protein LBR15_01800 [Methanobrevibacter sp.]|nr:hypothetical protein [Candidatus Methanovirga australis]